MSINRVFAQVIVAEIDAASAWYERLLGRPADANPLESLVEWHFDGTGGIQLVRDAAHAGSARLTLGVDGLEAFRAGAAGRGIPVGEITRGDRAQFAIVTDPDGNTITIAEAFRTPA